MIASRGCIGECAYCSIRAFSADAGGSRFRMRREEEVADEVALLYFQSGVRVILLQDDLFILPSEEKTVSRMQTLTDALKERGVGKVLFWIKGRPETITDAVLTAARKMGAIHLFLGVENASANRLEYLGRTHRPLDNTRAISRSLAHGIRPSFNFMIFDPDCEIQDVELTIDFAEQFLTLPWNLCRTEIYSGTRLLHRLKEQGRLRGDWRAYGYQMSSNTAEIMFRIMRVAFQKRAFSYDSLLNKLITLSFARQVHEELLPGPGTTAMSKKVNQLLVQVYRDTVSELRCILEFAKRADLSDVQRVGDFAIERAMALNEKDQPWLTRCEELGAFLDARGARVRQRMN